MSWLQTNALDTYARASRISNKGWAGNKYEAQCCMASCMEWHLPVQEEADWLRLFLFENKVGNIADSYMNSFNKPCSFLSHTSKLGSACPNTDCLTALYKIKSAQFELLLVKNKVNNNLHT